jgi:hypothetical protein
MRLAGVNRRVATHPDAAYKAVGDVQKAAVPYHRISSLTRIRTWNLAVNSRLLYR